MGHNFDFFVNCKKLRFPIMEKTKQLLESVAENYAVAAENICKYIEDPDEKKEQLNDLRKLTLEHAKLAHEFDLQEKAVLHVTSARGEYNVLFGDKGNGIVFGFSANFGNVL